MNKKFRKGTSILLILALVMTMLASPPLSQEVYADSPLVIQAENFTSQSGWQTDNITEATTDTGGGLHIGWTGAGQYLTYHVNIPTAGLYKVTFRIAGFKVSSPAILLKQGGPDGPTLCSINDPPSYGSTGFQNFVNATAFAELTAGEQDLVVYYNTKWCNTNWFSLERITKAENPTASPLPGTYAQTISASLYTITPDTQIYYTVDGSDPANGNLYNANNPIAISTDTELKVVAKRTGLSDR